MCVLPVYGLFLFTTLSGGGAVYLIQVCHIVTTTAGFTKPTYIFHMRSISHEAFFAVPWAIIENYEPETQLGPAISLKIDD